MQNKRKSLRFLRDLPNEQQNNKMSINGLRLAKQLLQFLEALAGNQHQNLVEVANGLIKNVIQQPEFSLMLLGWLHDSRGNAYRNLKGYRRAIEDYDRATEFEALGGRLIELPASEWKGLAEAA